MMHLSDQSKIDIFQSLQIQLFVFIGRSQIGL